MNAFCALVRREFSAFFITPFGWVLLAVSQFILAFNFIARIALYQISMLSSQAIHPAFPGVTEQISIALFAWSVPFLLLLIPLATMRAWSDERRYATLPLLLGAPIRRTTLALAKFTATFAFLLIPLLFLAIMAFSLNLGTTQDWGKLLTGLLALTLLTAASTALGLFFSSLSRHPAAAALSTAATLLFFWHIDWSAGTDLPYLGWAPLIAIPAQLAPFLGGLFSLSAFLYFLLLTALFLILSARQIGYLFQPKPLFFRVHSALFTFAALLLIWGASQLDHTVDLTREQSQTLSVAAQEIVTQLNEPVSLTLFVNQDSAARYRLERMVSRFKPHIPSLEVEWVNPEVEPDRARESGVTKNGEVLIDYADRQSRVELPTDTNMTYAFYRLLTSTRVWTVFLDGLDGRNPFGADNADYGYFSQQLENLGIQLQQLDYHAEPDIPDNVTTLIVTGYSTPDPERLAERLEQFVARGGNLLLLLEDHQKEAVAPLLEKLSLKLLSGRLIDSAGQAKYHLPNPAFLAVETLKTHAVTKNIAPPILLPIACSVEFTDLLHSTLVPLLEIDEIERILPHHQSALSTDQVSINALLGVISPSEQPSGRIALLCDSDLFSNAYIANGSNLPFGLNLVRWLNGEKESLSIPQPRRPDQRLSLSPRVAAGMELVFKFILPILLVVTGLTIRIWRRRRE